MVKNSANGLNLITRILTESESLIHPDFFQAPALRYWRRERSVLWLTSGCEAVEREEVDVLLTQP
jgi:hypothetical protein